jgi:hypothetical protein
MGVGAMLHACDLLEEVVPARLVWGNCAGIAEIIVKDRFMSRSFRPSGGLPEDQSLCCLLS